MAPSVSVLTGFDCRDKKAWKVLPIFSEASKTEWRDRTIGFAILHVNGKCHCLIL